MPNFSTFKKNVRFAAIAWAIMAVLQFGLLFFYVWLIYG